MSKYKNILLADDDEDDIEFFIEMLETVAPQAKCVVAINGHEALELLIATPSLFDLIFIDIHMPLLSGLEFLKRRKREKTWGHIPVVVLSTSWDEAGQCYELGANLYVTKPNSIKLYEKALATVLSYDFTQDCNELREVFTKQMKQPL